MTTAGHVTRQPIRVLEYGSVNRRLKLTEKPNPSLGLSLGLQEASLDYKPDTESTDILNNILPCYALCLLC